MGRSKVIVQSIEDAAKRKATFMKRKVGVMKKAMELSVLCHCDIALVMFDEHGDMFQFASTDLNTTLRRAFAHKGKKEAKNNDSLLRTHGVIKDQVEKQTEAPIGHQINLTPSASCGLELSANSFGTMLKGVERPSSPPSFPPSSPDSRDDFDVFDMTADEIFKAMTPEAQQPKFQSALPPKVQRNVDTLMRDISLMAKADDLIHDPFAMHSARGYQNGKDGSHFSPATVSLRASIC